MPLEAINAVLLDQIAGAIAGGVDVIQVREHDLDGRVYADLVRACLAVCGSNVRVVVNERLDIAVAAGAHGIHLRETSIDVSTARRLAARPMLVGRSVHNVRPPSPGGFGAASARADYLIAGSIYATESKPGVAPSLGLEGLEEVVRAAEDCPVWAVGGITAETIPDVVRCGASGIAAIGAFIPTSSTEVRSAVEKLTQRLRFSFDSRGSVP